MQHTDDMDFGGLNLEEDQIATMFGGPQSGMKVIAGREAGRPFGHFEDGRLDIGDERSSPLRIVEGDEIADFDQILSGGRQYDEPQRGSAFGRIAGAQFGKNLFGRDAGATIQSHFDRFAQRL